MFDRTVFAEKTHKTTAIMQREGNKKSWNICRLASVPGTLIPKFMIVGKGVTWYIVKDGSVKIRAVAASNLQQGLMIVVWTQSHNNELICDFNDHCDALSEEWLVLDSNKWLHSSSLIAHPPIHIHLKIPRTTKKSNIVFENPLKVKRISN